MSHEANLGSGTAATDCAPAPAPTPGATAVRPSCLVVDDEEPSRRALSKVLTAFGYPATAVGTGREALDCLEREEIGVVITDVRMPEMDGIELLGRVRARWPDQAVVVVTGVSEVDVAVKCLQLGALDFITKPYQLDDVKARVEQALDKRRLIIENQRYQTQLEEMVREQATRIEELFLEGVQSLAHALDAKDAYTKGHSARVGAYSGATARALGLSPDLVQIVELGAELHDIGKIGITDDILLKTDRLTDEEYRALMQHTLIGARILAKLLKNAPGALEIVRWHHERFAGGGFPDGLSGDALPVHVRIVTVADSFDAMTTARPYRGAMSAEEAMIELRECSGSQFDPVVVDAFIGAYPEGTAFPIPTPEHVQLHLPNEVAGVGRLS